MFAQTLLEPFGLLLGFLLVPLERTLHLGILGRSDQSVEHAQHVLLHCVRVVDVLDELLFQCSHRHLSFVGSPWSAPVRAPETGRESLTASFSRGRREEQNNLGTVVS